MWDHSDEVEEAAETRINTEFCKCLEISKNTFLYLTENQLSSSLPRDCKIIHLAFTTRTWKVTNICKFEDKFSKDKGKTSFEGKPLEEVFRFSFY